MFSHPGVDCLLSFFKSLSGCRKQQVQSCSYGLRRTSEWANCSPVLDSIMEGFVKVAYIRGSQLRLIQYLPPFSLPAIDLHLRNISYLTDTPIQSLEHVGQDYHSSFGSSAALEDIGRFYGLVQSVWSYTSSPTRGLMSVHRSSITRRKASSSNWRQRSMTFKSLTSASPSF